MVEAFLYQRKFPIVIDELSRLGASGTYEEGYVASRLQQSTAKITTNSACTNYEYAHLKSSYIPLWACL